jgi:alpha-galactosidase
MKKSIAIIVCILMLFSLASCGKTPVTADPMDPLAMAQAWVDTQIQQNTLFSFDYEGRSYAEHIKDWDKTVEKSENGWTVTYQNGDVTAWSEIVLDKQAVAIEWTNYFKNEGSSNSGVISNIQAINSSVSVTNPVFGTAEGSTPSGSDFQPITVDLTQTEHYRMSTQGGRSSQGAWPYFEIGNGEYGVMGGIGWTGDWTADFSAQGDEVSIVAGMQETKISLYAGEQMRTPMVMLQFYKGDSDAGHNAFRQLILKNYTPADKSGEPITYTPMFISCMASFGEDALLEEMNQAMEQGRRFDGLWIDASWFGEILPTQNLNESGWYNQVGNWYFIEDKYPNGNMLKVSNWLESQDMDLLVWFEPERAVPGTQLTVEHPEWFLKDRGSADDFWLFDMSNDEACDYMTQWLSGILQENKITWYRQDFNCDPAIRWHKADDDLGENRTGMTEIKYVTNLYRFLDGLIETNPGLIIDSCASGGKRLDLEMMSRSVPLWRTDLTCLEEYHSTPDKVRAVNYNLSRWLPIHACGYPYFNSESELYNMRSYMSAGYQLSATHDTTESVKQAIDEFYVCREMMSGDYYVLSAPLIDDVQTEDAAYEFYLPEEGRGYIIAFEPAQGKAEDVVYKLKGLEPEATYELTVADTGDVLTRTGAQLMSDGIGLRYPDAAISLLIYFNKI